MGSFLLISNTNTHILLQAGDNLQLNNVLEEKHQNGVIIVVVNSTSSFNDRHP